MLDSTYKIECADDMLAVEKRMSELVHGEHGRCSLLHTADYNRFRLKVLYGRDTLSDDFPVVHLDRLCMMWKDQTVHIYSDLQADVPVEGGMQGVLGKRGLDCYTEKDASCAAP